MSCKRALFRYQHNNIFSRTHSHSSLDFYALRHKNKVTNTREVPRKMHSKQKNRARDLFRSLSSTLIWVCLCNGTHLKTWKKRPFHSRFFPRVLATSSHFLQTLIQTVNQTHKRKSLNRRKI